MIKTESSNPALASGDQFDQYYGHCGSLDMPPYVWVDTGRTTAQPDREEGKNKNRIALFHGNPAVLRFANKIRGFPSPDCSGFGFNTGLKKKPSNR